jgi:hypothetical protein
MRLVIRHTNYGVIIVDDYLAEKYGYEDYIVLEFDEMQRDELVSDVNALTKHGYRPIGGISVRTGASSGAYLLQAMYRDPGSTDTYAV